MPELVPDSGKAKRATKAKLKEPQKTVAESSIELLQQLAEGLKDTALIACSGRVSITVYRQVEDNKLFGDDETRQAEIKIELELCRDENGNLREVGSRNPA